MKDVYILSIETSCDETSIAIVKNGVDVTKKEYVVTKPTYSNVYSSSILKVSRKIEEGINQVIKYFFKKISDSINE